MRSARVVAADPAPARHLEGGWLPPNDPNRGPSGPVIDGFNRRLAESGVMSEDDAAEEEAAPAVELGEGASVEGAPLARVASRLTWPQERSEIVRKQGDSVVRTPEGPRELSALLEATDTTYFATRQDFLRAVREVVGTGPIPTE